jgi:hypothetical protein
MPIEWAVERVWEELREEEEKEYKVRKFNITNYISR